MDHALHFEKFFSEFLLNVKDIMRKQMKESAAEPSQVNRYHNEFIVSRYFEMKANKSQLCKIKIIPIIKF
jgi:hypothetical protein